MTRGKRLVVLAFQAKAGLLNVADGVVGDLEQDRVLEPGRLRRAGRYHQTREKTDSDGRPGGAVIVHAFVG